MNTPVSPWQRTFEVRVHDLDFTTQLSPAALIRMGECMRWDIFSGDMIAVASRFVVRAQSLELRGEARYREDIELSTWVSRVGHTSLSFVSEARVPARDVTVARLSCVAVATDAEGRPAPVDPSARAFVRDVPGPTVMRDLPSEAPPEAHLHGLIVQQHDIDLLGHVNQARYPEFADSARRAAARAGALGGMDADRPVRTLQLSYDDEALPGATLQARSFAHGPDTVAVLLCDGGDGRVLHRALIGL